MNSKDKGFLPVEQAELATPDDSEGSQAGRGLPWHKPGYHQIGVEEVKGPGGSTILDAVTVS